ncbi:MAG: hypothetical protein NT129_03310, partial [Candidatus Aenigmarchaeota archaeon]|nr:hypothetical protein [Candidatus Aenigmarchaeota archaeon]
EELIEELKPEIKIEEEKEELESKREMRIEGEKNRIETPKVFQAVLVSPPLRKNKKIIWSRRCNYVRGI